MNAKRNGQLALALFLVLVLASVPAALAFEAEGTRPGSDSEAGYTYTWVDAYGKQGASWLTVPAGSLARAESTLSGDDLYDEAAGGTPWLTVPAGSLTWAGSTLSGDDLYDEAAGGTPWLSVAGFAKSPGTGLDLNSEILCVLGADELEARTAWAVEGGYSGDDAYDSAAGGTPELSLLPFAQDLSLVAACEVI